MKFQLRVPAMAALLLVTLLSATGCNRLKARDQLTKGIASFKAAKYEDAINHFQQALDYDPSYDVARLYLATTLASQVVPNLETPENLKTAQRAMDGFQQILAKDPKDKTALQQMASISFNLKKFDDAKNWQKKVIEVDPAASEAYYTIGVIDWMQSYKNATTILAADGLTDGGDGNPKKSKDACAKLQAQNTNLVNEGLEYLQKAVDNNATYEEAMTYLNLTYRRKADLECGNDPARKADLDKAQEWSDKAMGARKENERKKEEKNKGGVTM
jgi:tetratricopeptide (TPR) repeat protein